MGFLALFQYLPLCHKVPFGEEVPGWNSAEITFLKMLAAALHSAILAIAELQVCRVVALDDVLPHRVLGEVLAFVAVGHAIPRGRTEEAISTGRAFFNE